jgi:hypothetical protein
MAKKEAKKDNHLISHLLTTEFAGKTDSKKRELVILLNPCNNNNRYDLSFLTS